MTTEQTKLKIDYWEGGILKPNAVDDPRPEPEKGQDYVSFMAAHDWCHIQTIGSSQNGFSFEVWSHKDGKKWIMNIDAGASVAYDVLVIGLADYLDIMAFLSPIATASMLEGDTLASIFAMHREAEKAREEMKEMGKMVVERVKEAMAPCNEPDCPNCNARKEAEKNKNLHTH